MRSVMFLLPIDGGCQLRAKRRHRHINKYFAKDFAQRRQRQQRGILSVTGADRITSTYACRSVTMPSIVQQIECCWEVFQDLPLIVWRVFDLVSSSSFPQSLGSSS